MIVSSNNCQKDEKTALVEPVFGKQHLISALDSGNEQLFLLTLSEVKEAILRDLESN